MRSDPTLNITDSVEAGTGDALGGLVTSEADVYGIMFVRSTNDSLAGRAALEIRGNADSWL